MYVCSLESSANSALYKDTKALNLHALHLAIILLSQM